MNGTVVASDNDSASADSKTFTRPGVVELAPRVTLPPMPTPSAMDRRASRTALAHEARRIAEEVEGLYIQLEQVGALARDRHYMITHQEGVQQFDMLQASKALRCYASVLSLIASATAMPRPVDTKEVS